MRFHARVQIGQDLLLDKVYSGQGGAGTNWAATEKAYRDSLALSLQDAARKFVGDLRALDATATPQPETSGEVEG